VLTEVKKREDEYMYTQDITQRIGGLPHGLGLPHRDRRLFCHGELWLVENPALSSSVPTSTVSSSPNPGFLHTNRLVNAIQEWNAGRTRTGSNASNSTFASSHSADTTSTFTDLPKSPLSELSSRTSPLHFQDPRNIKPISPLPLLSTASTVQVFLFSDLIIFAQPRARRSSSKTQERNDHGSDRWNLLEDTGIAKVLDVAAASDGSDMIAVDVIPVQGDGLTGKHQVKTLYLTFQESADMTLSREVWISALRSACKPTLAAMSNPSLNEQERRSMTGLNEALDSHSSRILDTILASGLPPPKSPSMQLGGTEGDCVKLEREERGWWSMRFQQVLKEMQDEEKYT
ncbi:Protein T2, partial [Marasmius sp. AFHP31]